MNHQVYELRSITEKDYDFIYQVKKDAYKKYVEMYFGSWDENQQKEYFRKFIEAYKAEAYIITFEGTDIGFYNGCTSENAYEIGNICIIPEYQNRGIGTAILEKVLSEHSGEEIRIQYFKHNPVGRLYERLGFEHIGETAYHYQMMKNRNGGTIMAEYWDLYDANRNLLGRTVKRGDAFADGEYYVCCEVWIQNCRGQLLMTQRHPDKKAGGLWEFTGGGVLAGETTKQAAVRELDEELGIQVAESDILLLDVYKHKNYFMDIFVVREDFDMAALTLQPEEVVDAKWVSREELLQMIEEKQVVWSVGLRYGMYGERALYDSGKTSLG